MRFEDLQAWQRSRELTNAAYHLCRSKPLAIDFGLRDQIQRAAVSAMNNIAKGSTGKVRFLLFIVSDNNLAPREAALAVQLQVAEAGDIDVRSHPLTKTT